MIYPFDYEKEVAAARQTPRGKAYATPIPPRENDLLVSNHHDPVWIGQDFNYIFPREILDNVARGFVTDGTPYEGGFGGLDMFGVEWVYIPSVRGSMEKPGVHKVEDLDEWEKDVTIPDLDKLDWEAIGERCRKAIRPDKLTATMIFSGLFERLISLVGFEDAAVALIEDDQKDAVHRLFDLLCGYYDKLIDRLHRHCGVEYVVFHDDWGSQRDSFFSVATCREMLLPYLKRVVKSAHDRGVILNFHCCGSVGKLVPLMVEAGVDAWDGQDLNDIWGLYKQYGDKMNITLNRRMLDISEEEAKVWVDSIISHLERGKHLIIAGRQMNEIARELLYIRSREFYAKA